MYVYYDVMYSLERKKRAIITVVECTDSYPSTQYEPSECIWMVPGTVDPMVD